MRYTDLSGKTFGRLTVISKAEKQYKEERKRTHWLCRCECGTEKVINASSLTRGLTTSCGCYNKEIIRLEYGTAEFNKLFIDYKNASKKRNLSFELSSEKFKIITQSPCFYCGVKPSQISKGKGHYGEYVYNGIDRIDSSKGYIKGNVVPCCGRCNQAKMSETQKDFIEWVKQVYTHLGLDKI